MVVTITTVDPANGKIEGVGRDAAVIQIATPNGPLVRWPSEGEQWIVKRENGLWTLDGLLGGGPTPFDPGEALLYASKIWLPDGDHLVRMTELGLFSVKTFGALGDGQADDSVAIQKAIDAAVLHGGGIVYFPAGTYVCTGLSVLGTTPVRLQGAGIRKTNLVRLDTTGQTLLTIGGASFATQARADLVDLSLDGQLTTGLLLDAYRINDFLLQNVEFHWAPGTGWRLRQIFNSAFSNVQTTECGNGTTAPATLFDAFPVDQGGCATINAVNCQWEGNHGTDVKFTGDAANVAPSLNIVFVGTKMEGGSGAFPFIDLDYARGVYFIGGQIRRPSGRTGPIIRQGVQDGGTVDTNKTSGGTANKFIGFLFDVREGAAEPYLVDIGIGSILFDDLTIVGAAGLPSTAFFRIRSNVSANGFQLGEHINNLGRHLLIKDERAFPTVASVNGTMTLPFGSLLSVTGSNIVTGITPTFREDEVDLIFPGTAQLTDGGNLKLEGNLVGAGPAVIKLIRLRCDGADWYEISRSTT
jgi:hypothetical protein